MTVFELRDALQGKDGNKEVWVSIPTKAGKINIIKDAASIHTDAIEGAIVICADPLNKVQQEYVS